MASFGQLKTNTYSVSGNWYGELQFDWTSRKDTSQLGITYVDWTLKGVGRTGNSSGTKLYTEATLHTRCIGQTDFTRQWSVKGMNSYADETLAYGELEIIHEDDGNGYFCAEININYKYALFSNQQFKMYFYLDSNPKYTNCENPTSILITPSIQKPGGNVVIEWHGAAHGIANNISKYEISYQLGDETSWSDWSDSVESTSGSYTLTLPQDNNGVDSIRGKQIKARVKSIPTVTGYGPEAYYIQQENFCKINSLPNTPEVEVDKNILPSTGGRVNFTITPGSDSDSQTTSLYYSTSETGTKIDCGTNLQVDLKSSTIYYFWTYDGLEYSAATSQSININTKPTVTLEVSHIPYGETLLTASKGDNGQNGNDLYRFGLKYNGEYLVLSENQDTTKSLEDMRCVLQNETGQYLNSNTTYNYDFWVQRYDGVEWSEQTKSSEYSFSTPKIELKAVRETVSGWERVDGRFDKNVEIVIEGDINNYEPNNVNNDFILDTSSIPYDTNIQAVEFKNASDSIFYINAEESITKVKEIVLMPPANTTTPLGSFNAFISGTLNISLLGLSQQDYGLEAEPKLEILTSSTPIETDCVEAGNNDTFIYAANGKNIYDIFIASASSPSTIDITLKMYNKFGTGFSKTFSLSVNYDNTPEIINTTSLSIKGCSIDTWDFLISSMKASGQIEVWSYTQPKIFLEAWKGEKWDSLKEMVPSLVKGSTKDDTNTNTSMQKYQINFDESTESTELTIFANNIFANYDGSFSLRFRVNSIGTGYAEKNYSDLTMRAHRVPDGYFVKAEYINDGTLEATYEIKDSGYGDDVGEENGSINVIGIKIESDDDMVGITSIENNEIKIINFNEIIGNRDTLKISPIFESTLTASTIQNEQVSYSSTKQNENFQYIIVYNLSPTVSYRKNHLGINTNAIDNDNSSVLVIKNASDRELIRLEGVGDNTHNATINLITGAINGFIIDGGSW